MLVRRPAAGVDLPAVPTGPGRRLTVLPPALADRYTELVAAVAPHIEPRLSPFAVANRVARASVDPPALRLRPWRQERAEFVVRLARLLAEAPCVVFADVRECYASITAAVVRAALLRLGCPPPDADAVATFLARLGRHGVRGLPVGPLPSAVLANAVLDAMDRALARAGAPHLRWVDDVVARAAGRRDAGVVLGVLRRAAAGLGLELNEAKTRVVLDPGSVEPAPTVSTPRARVPVG